MWGISLTSADLKTLSSARGAAMSRRLTPSGGLRTALIRASQDFQELVWNLFVHHRIKHLTQSHADGLLPQVSFIETGCCSGRLSSRSVIDHLVGDLRVWKPLLLVFHVVVQRIRPAEVPVPLATG
jgi:hypothetical protein